MVDSPYLVDQIVPFLLDRTATKELTDHVTDFSFVLPVSAKGIVPSRKDQIVCLICLS
jgi:hypothetical protein